MKKPRCTFESYGHRCARAPLHGAPMCAFHVNRGAVSTFRATAGTAEPFAVETSRGAVMFRRVGAPIVAQESHEVTP